MLTADALIDRFVKSLNSGELEPLFAEEVPSCLRTTEVDEFPGLFNWQIQPISSAAWIDPFEERMGIKLPALYRSFVTRYSFAEFEYGPVFFFANTGGSLRNELASAAFCDTGIYPELVKGKLLQIGRAAGGHYDPVCFDMRRSIQTDAPMVRVDHEDLLIRKRIRCVEELYPSFGNLILEHKTNSPRIG